MNALQAGSTQRVRSVALLLAVLLPLGAAAATEPAPSGDLAPTPATGDDLAAVGVDFLDAFEKEVQALGSSLLDSFVSSTKSKLRGAQTPAVVTAVTAEEIALRGYTSLADVLRTVPGFYDVYDGVFHNFGVRGINGGLSAAGSSVKVMIDGVPVDFRPSTGNLFGEELIPIQAVERVEVIRGPASALYGANAFLGVVNVITKKSRNTQGLQLGAAGSLIRNQPGFGASAVQSSASDWMSLMVAASFQRLDRSGLQVPASSPALLGSRVPASLREASSGDLASPKSLLARSTLKLGVGTLEMLATVQNLESGGEFQPVGALSHETRVALLNQNYRVSWTTEPSDAISLVLSAGYLDASPTDRERLSLGRADYDLVRQAGTQGLSVAGEAQVTFSEQLSAVAGADFITEDHLVQSFDRVLTEDVRSANGTVIQRAGTVLPGKDHGLRREFKNLGVFAQGQAAWAKAWSAIVGARLDGAKWSSRQDVDVYPSVRAGIVYAPEASAYSLKLLYGSSFKSPSAEQLYTSPRTSLDVEGNGELHAQTAHTFELAGGYLLPAGKGEVTLNLFATNVRGRVEFIQRALFVQAQNKVDEWVAGGELDARWSVARPLQLRLSASVARVVESTEGSAFTSVAKAENSLYPFYQGHLLADYQLPFGGLRLGGELSYIGARTTSQSNALINGGAYELPAYVYTAASLTTGQRRVVSLGETSATVRVVNLANAAWVEPGFGGIDVPAQGRSVMLIVTQRM